MQQTEGVISLGVGEPDFPTPWHIREAAISALERGMTRYTSNNGLPELRMRIAAYWKEKYGVRFAPLSETLVTVGASQALDLACRAVLNPGDEVLIPEPCYVAYGPCVRFAEGIPVLIPSLARRNFHPDLDALERAVTDRTKAILVGYPNNPTGVSLTPEELGRIAWIAQTHDLIVISDEIYHDLTYGGRHISFSQIPGMRQRSIVICGFSKTHAMTGFRLGFVLGPKDLVAAMAKIHQHTMLCASHFAQYAALEALKKGEECVERMRDAYFLRKNLAVESLGKLGVKCTDPDGAFYIFACIEPWGLSSQAFAKKLLHHEKLAVVPGDAFGPSGEGWIRLSFANDEETLKEAFSRLGRFLRKI